MKKRSLENPDEEEEEEQEQEQEDNHDLDDDDVTKKQQDGTEEAGLDDVRGDAAHDTDNDDVIVDDSCVEGNNCGGNHHDDDHNEDDDHEDNENDDVDDDDLMDVRFTVGDYSSSTDNNNNKTGQQTKMDKSLPIVSIIPTKPPDDLVWDDNAILDCWNCSVTSHDGTTTTTSTNMPQQINGEWTIPLLQRGGQNIMVADSSEAYGMKQNTNDKMIEAIAAAADILNQWQPKSLALPSWAVDPYECAILLKETANDDVIATNRNDDGGTK